MSIKNHVGQNAGNLPADPDGQNEERAGWAAVAIAAFRSATGADIEDAVGDLLANIRHWCDRNNQHFELALDRANGHYEAETSVQQGEISQSLAALWSASPASGVHAGVVRAVSENEVIQHIGQGKHVVWEAKTLSGDLPVIGREATIIPSGEVTVRAPGLAHER